MNAACLARRSPAWVGLFALLCLPGCGGAEPVADAGPADANVALPDPFVVDLDTTAGPIAIEVHPEWAPRGAARVRELVEAGFYDDTRFFRVLPGFVAQWGLVSDERGSAPPIPDDPVVESNTRGRVTFATAGPNTRTTQLFINLGDNSQLDAMGFAPVGQLTEGTLANADEINAEYGDAPEQSRIRMQGNGYLDALFPGLTVVRSARIR